MKFKLTPWLNFSVILNTTIPKVSKSKQNCWIAKELFYYPHPFIFPDLLKRKLTKHEFEVSFKFIPIFSSLAIEKTFYIKDFFQNYSSTLTNQQKTKIKNILFN
jgi:hypothetical protein